MTFTSVKCLPVGLSSWIRQVRPLETLILSPIRWILSPLLTHKSYPKPSVQGSDQALQVQRFPRGEPHDRGGGREITVITVQCGALLWEAGSSRCQEMPVEVTWSRYLSRVQLEGRHSRKKA